MRALQRKMFRDLWILRGPSLAIGLVMASGVATFVMSLSTLSTLYHARLSYYERYRFANVFVNVKRAPETLKSRLAEIPGVMHVGTRITQFVNLDLPDMREPATGRLLSLPDHGEPAVNRLYLRSGRWPELERPDEVLISDGFATAHRLQSGDRVRAILNGRRQDLRIVGIALSPEFIYQIREGDIIPDDRRFGIFWMRRRSLEAAFQMTGAFNNAVLLLSPGTDELQTIREVDRLTDPYGGTGAYGRGEQSSHKFISNEMEELRGMALFVPTIFILVAAWMMQVVFSRLIGTQREQIATLKAFGYSSTEVGLHYLQFVIFLAWLGTGLGIGVGTWLGRGVATMYSRFFHFPEFDFHLDSRVVLASIVISTLSAGIAVIIPVRKAMHLPPAEAMRPELPPAFGSTWLESLAVLRRAPVELRMIVRQMIRQPIRLTLTCLGLSLAVAVLILGSFMLDGLNYVMESEFNVAQRQDMTLTFVEPSQGRVLSEVAHLPGVISAEPFRSVPVRLRSEHHSRRLGLMGLRTNGRLFRIANVHRQSQSVPETGLILSSQLARVLSVRPGETVTIEVLEGRRPVQSMRVAGLVEDFQGEAAYASIDAVHRLMQEGDAVSGAFLAADTRQTAELYRELKRTPRLIGASLKGSALIALRETIISSILLMRTFNIGFACIIACGVVYNSARITLAERTRELATMRVIGFTRGEIGRILLGELAILTLLAIPLGLGIGHVMADFVIRAAYDTELFRIPLVIARSTDALAALVTLLAAVCTGLIVSHRLARLDLVAVLKTRE
ncbi:MAG: ABC transporter permease [Planctomycetes bacterium]|nr:ABC transporter permease [Planctomycetota bacterium]